MLVGQACDAAEKFVSLYYERFDKQRHVGLLIDFLLLI